MGSALDNFGCSRLNFFPKIRNKFKFEWQAIMRKMEIAEGIVVPNNVSEVDANAIENTFMLVTNHLKENVCSFLLKKNAIMKIGQS